jgi:hypothetical protein
LFGTVVSYEVGVGTDWSADRGHVAGDGADVVDARLEALLAAASGPVNWRSVVSGDAGGRWSELRDWVDWFRLEFAFDHRVVPPCWYRHRALVSVLSALRDHWVSAYDPLNTPVGASDWHRALMHLEVRLREWASRTGCTVGAHRPDVLAQYPDDTETWKAHVAADVAARAEHEMGTAVASAGRAFRVIGPDRRGVTADG